MCPGPRYTRHWSLFPHFHERGEEGGLEAEAGELSEGAVVLAGNGMFACRYIEWVPRVTVVRVTVVRRVARRYDLSVHQETK